MAVTEILLGLAIIIGSIVLWCKHSFSYWKRKNVPYAEPTPFLGNADVIFTLKKNFPLHLADIYKDPKFANEAVVGVYAMNQPALLLRDLELIKKVLIKDFSKFSNRNVCCDNKKDPLAFYNLFFVKNPYWKEIRTKLSPIFTSGKIKQMYPLILEIGNELEQNLSRYERVNNSFEIEIKETCARFTTDSIATIAFGVRANSLRNPNAEFRKYGRKFVELNFRQAFNFFVAFFMPKLIHLFRITITPPGVAEGLRTTFSHVISERETTGNKRNDVIDMLVGLKKDAQLPENRNHYINDQDFLLAQPTIFLVAGFETSSTTMTMCLFELAKHPDIQARVRREILDAHLKEQGDLSFETLNSLEYLSMVLDETLRLYPVLPFLDRVYECKTDEPDFSLKPYYDYTLPNDMPVFITNYGKQHDPKYWPNPEKFDPERFRDRTTINPMTYLPCGDGPHNCIGKRIGLLQAKIGLIYKYFFFFLIFNLINYQHLSTTMTTITLKMHCKHIYKRTV